MKTSKLKAQYLLAESLLIGMSNSSALVEPDFHRQVNPKLA